MSQRFLVTGGAGFIGSHVVHLLAERGDQVTVVDNLVNGRRENLAHVRSDRCRLVVADVRDDSAMGPLLDGTDVVLHLACLGVRHSLRAPRENHEVNATATLQLLEAARAAGVRRFVHVSSSEVYGTAITVPMREDHPTRPATVYGASKLAGESYARAAFSTHGFPTVVVRPFNAYGPRSHHEGDSGEVIPRFVLRGMAGRPLVIFGDGEQTRDFTYVEDTARGIVAAATAPDAIGQTINLGSGGEVSIRSLATLVGKVIGRPVTVEHDAPRPGDVHRLYADASLANRLLGFKPGTHLEEGLSKLRSWYQGLGVSADELLQHEQVRNWE